MLNLKLNADILKNETYVLLMWHKTRTLVDGQRQRRQIATPWRKYPTMDEKVSK